MDHCIHKEEILLICIDHGSWNFLLSSGETDNLQELQYIKNNFM